MLPRERETPFIVGSEMDMVIVDFIYYSVLKARSIGKITGPQDSMMWFDLWSGYNVFCGFHVSID